MLAVAASATKIVPVMSTLAALTLSWRRQPLRAQQPSRSRRVASRAVALKLEMSPAHVRVKCICVVGMLLDMLR